jgi:hypothetical protein
MGTGLPHCCFAYVLYSALFEFGIAASTACFCTSHFGALALGVGQSAYLDERWDCGCRWTNAYPNIDEYTLQYIMLCALQNMVDFITSGLR